MDSLELVPSLRIIFTGLFRVDFLFLGNTDVRPFVSFLLQRYVFLFFLGVILGHLCGIIRLNRASDIFKGRTIPLTLLLLRKGNKIMSWGKECSERWNQGVPEYKQVNYWWSRIFIMRKTVFGIEKIKGKILNHLCIYCFYTYQCFDTVAWYRSILHALVSPPFNFSYDLLLPAVFVPSSTLSYASASLETTRSLYPFNAIRFPLVLSR